MERLWRRQGQGKGYSNPSYAYASEKGKGYFNMSPKGFGKGQCEQPRRRACFGCGSLEHLQRDCPKMLGAVEGEAAHVQHVSFSEEDEVIIIGNVTAQEEVGKFTEVKARKKRKYRKINPDEDTEICAVVGMTFQATDVKKAWRRP